MSRYMSPLMQQLRADIRPPIAAADLLLSDKPLPNPWFGKTRPMSREFGQMSDASQWLDAHELIARSPNGDGSMVWTRKGELYRARIRAAGLTSILDVWDWSKLGNGPSVWLLPTNGRPWS